ncbi:MAG: DUF6662 family protein [Verrucomicrobiota bacterium]
MKKLMMYPRPRNLFAGLVVGALLLTSANFACADERFFTYSYDADVLPKGAWEFEQWLTHRRGKAGETFSRWDFREEIEYGLLDNLSTSLYLNFRDTHTDDGVTSESKFEFKGISSEWKYRLLNPNTDPVGLALYFEPTYNGTEVELEEKLILSKNFGEKWQAAFNVSLEQEWEFEHNETRRESVLEFTGGVSYKLTPHWALGLEARNHRVFEGVDYGDKIASAWFVGPAVHYGSSKWWATLTMLPQIQGSPSTNGGRELKEHTKLEARLIVGINF